MQSYRTTLLLFIGLVTISITFQSCGNYTKQLAWHESELARAANTDMPANQKLDILLNSFVSLANESLRPINPKKGIKYIQKYNTTNQKNIDKILADVNTWHQNMNELQTLAAGVNVARKPYTKQFIELVPKFRKKYRQYKTAINLTNKITGGMKGFGGKLLEGVLN